jgi:hypothetical protein
MLESTLPDEGRRQLQLRQPRIDDASPYGTMSRREIAGGHGFQEDASDFLRVSEAPSGFVPAGALA